MFNAFGGAAALLMDCMSSAGTARVLPEVDPSGTLTPAFVPSKANAEALSTELPRAPTAGDAQQANSGNHQPEGSSGARAPTVLYPASAKARSTLQKGLEARGFSVTRLNTYDTVPLESCPDEQLQQALACKVVAIASPSALEAWAGLVGLEQVKRQLVACIGSTSANAALELGLHGEAVFWEEDPGMEGFVSSVLRALEQEHAHVLEAP
jgi:uroporphyrinogen-III synthase